MKEKNPAEKENTNQEPTHHVKHEEHDQDTVLDVCEKERDEYKEKFLRSVADFENFKRRNNQERASLVDFGKKSVLLDLLAVVSDFERALDQKIKTQDIQGFALIHKSLKKLLTTHGVTEVTNLTTFDPELHEALVHVASENHQTGEIVEVVQKGYLYKDILLQPAKVTVAK